MSEKEKSDEYKSYQLLAYAANNKLMGYICQVIDHFCKKTTTIIKTKYDHSLDGYLLSKENVQEITKATIELRQILHKIYYDYYDIKKAKEIKDDEVPAKNTDEVY